MRTTKRRKKEIALVLFCLTAAVISSGLLYRSFSGTNESITKPIGSVAFKIKDVQRKLFKSDLWEIIHKNSEVYNKDKIKTSDHSLVSINLNLGSIIELDENTLVYLEFDGEFTTIELLEGSIHTKGADSGSKLKIKSDNTIFDSSNSSASIYKDKDGSIKLTVHDGELKISSADGTKNVKAGDSALVDDEKITVIKNMIRIDSPTSNRYYISNSSDANISFSWTDPADDAPYVLLISNNSSFDKYNTYNSKSESIDLKLETGTYYCMVKNDSGDKQSSVIKFSIIYDSRPYLILPEKNGTIESYSTNPVISFSWGASTMPSKYTVEIYSDSELKNIVLKTDTETKSIDADTLTYGTYYWLVKAHYSISPEDTIVSDIGSFQVNKSSTISQPVLLQPLNNETFSSDFFKKNRMMFSWNRNADIAQYEIQISTDMDFNSIYYKSNTINSSIKAEKHMPPGTYYWRLKYFDEAKKKEVYTDIRSFIVISETNIEPLSPGNRAVISSDRTIRIHWKDPSMWNNYKVELSTDHEFRDIRESIVTRNNYADVHVAEGTYFWRVSRLDDKGRPISTYSGGTFAVSSSATEETSRISIVEPKNGSIIDMTHKSVIRISWRDEDKPDKYKVELLQNGIVKFLTETTKTSLNFAELHKLDRGNFSIRITSIVSKKSGAYTETDFEIVLKPLKKPELITDEIIITE
ncbi:MAG: FecR domain-containing protein [Spirochaetes bacterium]|nr:FecR domain-containing protein [Spirochaetota bacterium]